MKTINNKIAIAATVSALFFSGAAMAGQSTGSVAVQGSVGAATCTVELPNTTVSFPALTNGELSNAPQWDVISEQTTNPIVVRDCGDSGASLTVTSSAPVEGGYAYPRVGGTAQRDMALWMKVDNKDATYNKPTQIKDGSLPIKFELVKTSNSKNISYTGSWDNQYTLTATYN
ncbi:TPA: adhesin [Escherichia coli]|nr:adhesin [Escherichia coli]